MKEKHLIIIEEYNDDCSNKYVIFEKELKAKSCSSALSHFDEFRTGKSNRLLISCIHNERCNTCMSFIPLLEKK